MVSAAMPGPLSATGDRGLFAEVDGERYLGLNAGFLAGIKRVIPEFLRHDERPMIGGVAGLKLQLLQGSRIPRGGRW